MSDEFSSHLDLNTSANYQYITVSRAFSVWVELTSAMYMATVLAFFLAIGDGKSLGFIVIIHITDTSYALIQKPRVAT